MANRIFRSFVIFLCIFAIYMFVSLDFLRTLDFEKIAGYATFLSYNKKDKTQDSTKHYFNDTPKASSVLAAEEYEKNKYSSVNDKVLKDSEVALGIIPSSNTSFKCASIQEYERENKSDNATYIVPKPDYNFEPSIAKFIEEGIYVYNEKYLSDNAFDYVPLLGNGVIKPINQSDYQYARGALRDQVLSNIYNKISRDGQVFQRTIYYDENNVRKYVDDVQSYDEIVINNPVSAQ